MADTIRLRITDRDASGNVILVKDRKMFLGRAMFEAQADPAVSIAELTVPRIVFYNGGTRETRTIERLEA
jgi:hypothetical protein